MTPLDRHFHKHSIDKLVSFFFLQSDYISGSTTTYHYRSDIQYANIPVINMGRSYQVANILCVQISYEYINQRQNLSQYFSSKNGMLSKHKMISAQLPLNALFCLVFLFVSLFAVFCGNRLSLQ